MTDTTQRVYEYILRFKREFDGLAPSLREICMVCGLSSTSQATYHLRRLEEQGKVLLLGGHASRGIMVVGGRWEVHYHHRDTENAEKSETECRDE